MFGNRLIKSNNAAAACTTDTVQILDGVPLESIATYQLNNATTSIPSNTYPGTPTDITYATGKFGQAAVFNGSSSKILASVPKSSNQSFSFWTKHGTQSNSTATYLGYSNTGSNGFFSLCISSGNFSILYWNGSTYARNTSTINIADNTWHHVVLNTVGNVFTIYLDGNTTPVYTTTLSGFTHAARNDLQISFETPDGAASYFNGSIDQVRIFNTALSAGAVTSLYNETVATASNSYINVPSCVAYYKMSDATDETGSYDGTPTNVNFNVAGKFGNAGYFNGSSSVINFATNPLDITTDFTVSGWMNQDSSDASLYLFACTDTNSSNIYFNLNLQSSQNRIELIYNNVGYYPPFTYQSGWHHYAVTLTGTSLKTYRNGSLFNTQTVGISSSSGNRQTIGARLRQSNSSYGDGKIDQVRIFDRAITANEVETLYNEVQCIPIIVPTDHFEPVIYTGDGQPTRNITGLGFQPDLVWIKGRTPNTLNHVLNDSVRGANKKLASDSTAAEVSPSIYGAVSSFTSDGFNLAKGSDNTYAGGLEVNGNLNSQTYVAWNWKAGGADVLNEEGTIDSQVSANVDAGFSIVKYTGNSTAGATIGHGLNSAPELIITKNLNDSEHWVVGNSSVGWTKGLYLSAIIAAFTNNKIYGVDPTSTVYTVSGGGFDSTNTLVNTINKNYIAYTFHSVDGYSKIGSYAGTGASGNSIVTGFRPAFVMMKAYDDTSDWFIVDNKRNLTDPRNSNLRPNNSNAEANAASGLNFLSNGFEFTGAAFNDNNVSWIYMAFAEENAQPEPELANSFNVVTYTGNGSTQNVTGLGFQPDLVWIKERNNPIDHLLFDTIRGAGVYQRTNLASNEPSPQLATLSSFDSNGFSVGTDGGVNGNNDTYVAWCWKASNDSTINQEGSITSIVSANPAAGFSVVSYTGNTSTSLTYGHGLDSAPEMIITKRRSGGNAQNWVVYHTGLTSENYYLELNTTSAELNGAGTAFNSNTSSTVVGIGNSGVVNQSYPYISYCFHSTDNQKVGSYAGTNAAGNFIETGFQPRFLLTKRSSAAGGGWNIFDSTRGTDKRLYPNLSNAEGTDSPEVVTFNSNGFTFNTADSWNNGSYTYIYLAIA
jgi:hypothetical protein